MKKTIALVLLALILSPSANAFPILSRLNPLHKTTIVETNHKRHFWTKETKVEVGVLLGTSLVDGIATGKALHAGAKEYNPLTRGLVAHGTPAVVACEIGSGVVIGTSYLLFRLHHDRMSKWTLRIAAVAEGAGMVREVAIVP